MLPIVGPVRRTDQRTAGGRALGWSTRPLRSRVSAVLGLEDHLHAGPGLLRDNDRLLADNDAEAREVVPHADDVGVRRQGAGVGRTGQAGVGDRLPRRDDPLLPRRAESSRRADPVGP